jgi:hypothetical protein
MFNAKLGINEGETLDDKLNNTLNGKLGLREGETLDGKLGLFKGEALDKISSPAGVRR